MPRLARFNLPGYPQHVIIRGNNREPIFVDKDDYHFYLEKLERAMSLWACELNAFVLTRPITYIYL
jgi:putative transposase